MYELTERQELISFHRKNQPIEELERKAKKARSKANLWTQEELDLAARKAFDLFVDIALNMGDCNE